MAREHRESFADLLRQFRRAAGLTQQALADQSQVSRRTIADLERGINRPHKTTMALLADALRLGDQDRVLFESALRRSPLKTTPLASASPVSTLPHLLTRLIGREQEEGMILRLILHDRKRLVTLIGTAGIGKTRLAISIANKLSPHYADGDFFVPLAHLQNWEMIPASIAQALHIQEDKTQSLWDLITSFLEARTTLIVLDNLEHLLEGAAFVADLLAACPNLVILVTSRAALRVRGEQRFLVPPLSYTADAGKSSASEDLFIERAREVQPLLPLTSANAASIAEICRRLEGIPLAIELAAMRVAMFSPADLLRHLEHRLSLLVGGAHDLPQRQRTMRDAVAWSYDLLSSHAQFVFRRLAVFVGGWTFTAAQVVCGDDITPDEMPLLLSSLIETNLIQRWPGEDAEESRYGMLEILREYGLEQLKSRGELESALRRHAEWMLALAHEAEIALHGPEQGQWLRLLDQELGNLRAALHWAREHDTHLGLCVADSLWRFWYERWHLGEGLTWIAEFLERPQDDLGRSDLQTLYAHANLIASNLSVLLGKYERAEYFAAASCHLYQEAGDVAGMCSAMNALGNVANLSECYQVAEARYRKAATLSRSQGDKRRLAVALQNVAVVATIQGCYHEAHISLEESLCYRRELGDQDEIATCLVTFSNLLNKEEKYTQARIVAEEALFFGKQADSGHSIATALDELGKADLGLGDYQLALAELEQSFQIFVDLQDVVSLAMVLRHQGDVAYMQSEWQQAETCYAESIRQSQRARKASSVAKSLAGWARALLAQGQAEQAATYASNALAIFDEIGISAQAKIAVSLRKTTNAIQETMGEDAFQAAWEQGKTLSLKELLRSR